METDLSIIDFHAHLRGDAPVRLPELTGGVYIKELAELMEPLTRQVAGICGMHFRDPFSRFLFRQNFRGSMTMGAAIHETGGARMGDDPSDSVLNPHNQSWEVPNLFVTDGSSFTSSGCAGATLTIMALTVRACEHIAREHGAGRL